MAEENTPFMEVARFYDSEIARFWEMVHKRQMHVGYWDDENEAGDLAAGSQRLTELMISMADMKQAENFIDIGCGFGIPAIMLARARQCKVSGITINSSQQAEARNLAAAEKADQLVTFIVGDANHLPFPPASFDGGWFFESIFHIGHENALREAARVLKQGAYLLIADFIQLKPLRDKDKALLLSEFYINSIMEKEQYAGLLDRQGFKIAELHDITDFTIKKRKAKHEQAFIMYDRQIRQLIKDEEKYKRLKEFWFKACELIEQSAGYVIIKAQKRPAP